MSFCLPAPLLLLNQVVSLTSAAYRYSALLLLCLFSMGSSAQTRTDSLPLEVIRHASLDTIYTRVPDTAAYVALPNTKRVYTVAGLHAGMYGGSLLLLNQAWYKDYPKTSFQTFNDSKEWQQVDKVGHAWSAYQLSRASMASWKWAGLNRNQQIWLGGMSGFAFQTVIEVLDAHSAEWGWSWSDIAANTVGSGLLIGQELAWAEQRISFKFSFHKMNYSQGMLEQRANNLFGSSLPERMLKDYNGQTYWLSANLKSFFKQSNLPPWLNIAVGYGAGGMLGGFSNTWTEGSSTFTRNDVQRVREFYLAPDIDFTRIRTRSKFLKSVFFCLNAFKLPAPTLVLSNGKMRLHGLYF